MEDTTLTLAGLLDDLEPRLAEDERVLRNQAANGELAPKAEAMLAQIKAEPERLRRVLRLYAYIRHLFLAAHEGLSHAGEDEREALAQLMARDPVPVTLAGRTVYVTGRSWEAYRRIAQHSNRIAEIQVALGDAAHLQAALSMRAAREPDRGQRRRWRRHLERLGIVTRALMYESALNRQALYAHIFTPSGAPAASLDEAPEWWTEITPSDDTLVMRAMWEAGPGRYQKVQDPFAPGGPPRGEDRFGFHSHFALVSRNERVPPAEPYQRDFYQHLGFIETLGAAMRERDAGPDLDDE